MRRSLRKKHIRQEKEEGEITCNDLERRGIFWLLVVDAGPELQPSKLPINSLSIEGGRKGSMLVSPSTTPTVHPGQILKKQQEEREE